jgi:hypothetical protein
MAAKTIITAVTPCMPKALLVEPAFRRKNDQHVAHGDDGFHKQADPAGRAPHHERQYSQPRYDVSHPLEAKPPSDVGAVFRSGRPKLRIAVNGLTIYWVPIAMIATPTSSAVPSANQCITLSF